MRIPRVLCLTHQQEMVIFQTGRLIECLLNDGSPYYKIYVDAYHCPDAGCEVLMPADKALSEHYMANYNDSSAQSIIYLR